MTSPERFFPAYARYPLQNLAQLTSVVKQKLEIMLRNILRTLLPVRGMIGRLLDMMADSPALGAYERPAPVYDEVMDINGMTGGYNLQAA